MVGKNEDRYSDPVEIDLFELLGRGWNIILTHKKWAVFSPIFFLFLGAVLLKSRPPQWEASALLVMSRTCGGDIASPCRFYELSEPVDTLVARASSPEFQAAVLKTCGIDPAVRDAALYRESQSVKFASGPNYVDIKVRAYSQKTAKDLVSTVAAELARSNAAAASQRVNALKEQKVLAQKALALLAPLAGGGKQDPSSGLTQVLSSYLGLELQAKVKAISEQIDFTEKNTASFMAAKSGASIVNPKTFLLLVTMGLFGVFMGILIPLLIELVRPSGR